MSTGPHTKRTWIRRSLIAALAAVVLVVATFEGYAFYTRHRGVKYAHGGPFMVDGTSTQPAGPTPPGAPGRAAAIVGGGSAPPGTGATGAGSAAGGGSAGSGPASLAPPGPGAPASARPRAGRYALAVSGTESVSFGPVAFCHNHFPTAAGLVVAPAADEPAGSYDFDLRLYPASPNAHDERHIYRYSAAQVSLLFEEVTVTCGGVEQSTTVDYTPPQLRVQMPLSVGERWTNHGGNASRTEDTVSTVTGRDTVVVGSSSYATYVVQTQVQMTGSEHGRRTQTWWWSPGLAFPVRFAEQIHASRSGASYSEDYTATVSSLPPV